MVQDDRPLVREYSAACRAYGVDIAASILLYVSASLMSGRVWRFSFDDELIALASIESQMTIGQELDARRIPHRL